MPHRSLVFLIGLACALPLAAQAQSTARETGALTLELNTVQETGSACRLTFTAQNDTGAAIEQAVFETVIFDESGGVVSLSLFDFQRLPADRLRVRQFDLPGMACTAIGRVLINGANACLVDGGASTVCEDGLTLSTRVAVELVG